jgi:hypothetical protein
MTMPNDKWNISNTSTSPSIGNDLTGLRIKKTGSGYELYKVVAKTTSTSPPFDFDNFTYDGQSWDMHVTTLAPGQDGGGTWQTPSAGGGIKADPADGDFTAQAGGGAEEDEDEASSSASA